MNLAALVFDQKKRLIRLVGPLALLSSAFSTSGRALQEGDGSTEDGHGGKGSPSAFASRQAATATPTKKGRPTTDATVKTEEAVLEGLCWLLRHQNEDGSWGATTLPSHCTPGKPCISAKTVLVPDYDEGLTGLALLAFLAQGISVGSSIEIIDTVTGKRHAAGEVVEKGIKWLVDRQRKDGAFSNPDFSFALYNEALAAMAVCEAYGIAQRRELESPAQKAVDYLVAAQKIEEQGSLWGWRYFSRKHLDERLDAGVISESQHAGLVQDVDISVTTWVVMALKSAQLVGLSVPSEVMDGALAYARHTTGKKGLVGYQSPDQAGESVKGPGDRFTYHTATMSALGMLVRTFVSRDIKDPFLELAAKHIVKDLPAVSADKLSIDYYYWYQAALALNQFDGPESPRTGAGKYWRPWNRALVAALLSLQNQSTTPKACSRGGWLDDDRWGGSTGHALYSTAINVLTLEVYYRYENAFRP